MSVSLSAPYTVFPLSLPLHRRRAKDADGSSYRPCYTALVESRKRKRSNGSTEIVTAVDGEGVNIYDVPNKQPKAPTPVSFRPVLTCNSRRCGPRKPSLPTPCRPPRSLLALPPPP